jgi:hypothetical protein
MLIPQYQPDNLCCNQGVLISGLLTYLVISGINIVRYDFSEAQAGKSYCDAKIAHMRSKLRMFVSSGENVMTPFDMKNGIMYGSGVAGCQCAVVKVDRKKQTMTSHGIKGITNINNLAF